MKQWLGAGLVGVTLVGLVSLSESAIAADNGDRYLNVDKAISQITTGITSKRNDIRNRFPFSPDLFDSKNVTPIARRQFTPTNVNKPGGVQFKSSFQQPPGGNPSVLNQRTGGGFSGSAGPSGNLLGDDDDKFNFIGD